MPQTIQEHNELISPQGHPDVGKDCFSILAEVIDDKESRGLIEKWNRAAELTHNKHWKNKSGKPGLVTANLLFAHRQRTVNMLTDNNPTFNVSRMGQPDEAGEDFSEKVLRLSEFWWSDQEQQGVFEKSVGLGEENGACVEKVIFNPEIEIGGEVETQNIPLFNFGVYPVNCTEPKKADAMVHYYPMSVRKARRIWPEFSDKIQPDDDILKEIGDNRREIAANSSNQDQGYLSTFVSVVKNIVNKSSGNKEESRDEVLIVEIWVRDYTEVPEGDPVIDPETGQMMQAYVPKYKGNIRMIRTCNAGRVVMEDKDNPSINPNLSLEQARNCYLFDKFPFAMAQSITDAAGVWGLSDYEQLEGLNIEVNKTISQLTLFKDKASRLKIINPNDSGVPNEHFTNKPGILNPTSAILSQGIRYMENPPIPVELINTLNVYKDLFFTVSGSFDLEQANTKGKDVIAYKAIAALIERASTMLKGKIRNYSRLIRERGRMFISMAQNWYTEERWISYDDEGVESLMPVKGSDILFPAKISVVSGSTMPRARIQEREEAISLYFKGALPIDELYKKLDYPNRKNLVKKMQAGPLGALIEKLEAIGTPKQVLQYINEVANADDKHFEKLVKNGEFPSFSSVLQAVAANGVPVDPYEAKQAIEINKTKSEIMLNAEMARTEKVKQMAAIAGIKFDAESLRQNWAKINSIIDDQVAKNIMQGVETGIKMGQHTEKGMKSNNKVR